uniref:Uncharacterized protein n=1 Tax=Parascaris equorum TaxID=6256 RepID=A0A914R5S2_PAREQ
MMPYKINRFYFLAFLTWQFCILYVTQQIFGIFANYTPKWRCNANETFNSDCDVFVACDTGVEFEEVNLKEKRRLIFIAHCFVLLMSASSRLSAIKGSEKTIVTVNV